MNHLRDLLDSLKGDLYAHPENSITGAELEGVANEVIRVGESAVSFYIGEIGTLAEMKFIPELIRLPYPVCWFESNFATSDLKSPLSIWGVLVERQDDGSCHGAVYEKLRGQWVFWGAVGGLEGKPESWTATGETHLVQTGNSLQARVVFSFLSALHCSNAVLRGHAPEATLQKARLKRGKRPFFSYWTLELVGSGDRAQYAGGTHLSPRVHLRRGHPREYSPGKFTWVQPCVVGNKSAGMVNKDYSAGRALLLSPERPSGMQVH